MSAVSLFKVWNVNRQKKVLIGLDTNDEKFYFNLILEASKKLDIDGTSLVLESDGTVVEEEVLKLVQKETLILLGKGEEWISDLNLSISSTITASSVLEYSESGDSSRASSPVVNVCNQSNERVSESTWKKIEIPWEVFSKNVMEDCKKGIRNYISINTVVHTIVDRIREIKVYVPSKAFKIIANKIIDKFPSTFQDVDEEGIIVGDGAHTLTQKLIERNNYLNRPHKRKSSQPLGISPKLKKKMLACKAGCSNWQPINNSNLEKNTLEDYKGYLKNYVSEDENKIKFWLEESYPNQRIFLNKPEEPPSVDDIMREWPILLQPKGLYWHYEKLMGHTIHNFIEVYRTKVDKILKFGLNKKYILELPKDAIERKINGICIIGKFFREDVENQMIISLNKNGGTADDVLKMVNHNAPCILWKLGSLEKEYEFSIYTEKKLIQTVDNFEEAFKIFWSIYYNLNLSYPTMLSMTLEFIQRYLLKINPDQGSKGKKKGTGLVKLCSLMNKLKDM